MAPAAPGKFSPKISEISEDFHFRCKMFLQICARRLEMVVVSSASGIAGHDQT